MSTLFEMAHETATEAARNAANTYFQEQLGGEDRYACGFAWVTVYPEFKGNTRAGKAERALLEKVGFRKDWTGKSYQLWNPSGHGAQNVDTKYAGARAYAEVFGDLTGVRISAGERLD